MNKFMSEALNEAYEGIKNHHGGPFGSVVVKDGEIIGRGHNCVLRDNDPTAHAEVNAIRAACKKVGSYDLSGCVLYTTAYPCPMCLSAIIWANIKKVYFGCRPEDAEHIGFRDDFMYHFIEAKCRDKSVLDMAELDRADCLKLFEEYQQKAKTIY